MPALLADVNFGDGGAGCLPSAAGEPVAPRETFSSDSAKTILLVDDNESFRALLEQVLRKEGYRTETAADGKAAWRLVQTKRCDVIVTDLCMPGTDGMELLVRLYASDKSIPVIVMSGGAYGHIEWLLKAAKLLGAQRTLAKPFTMEALLAAVRETLAAT